MSSQKDSSSTTKFTDQVEVSDQFVNFYFRSDKGKGKFDALIRGLNVVVRIEAHAECASKRIVEIEATTPECVVKVKMKILQALFA